MATQVTPLQPVRAAPRLSAETAEEKYWKSFASQLQKPSPHSNAITHISHPVPSTDLTASPTPEVFAVTSGQKIQVFSSRSRKVVKTINRINIDDVAYSGSIRRDGRLLLAGGHSGIIQGFQIDSRSILGTWKEHKQPVWCTKWHPKDLTTFMSASDDKTVRLWDLPSSQSTHTFHGHQDYVRSGLFMPGQAERLLVTGSYDKTVRLWDPRTPGKSVMIFQHAAPMESLLPLPSGTTLLASAGNTVSVLDLIGARPLTQLKNHQKTITAMALASNGTRVLTGALDGHVKVFETTAWNVVAGMKYHSPILSLDVIGSGPKNEDKHIVVGMQSGLLSIRTRLSAQQKQQQREREREMEALAAGKIEEYDKKRGRPLTTAQKRRLRGKDYTGEGVDIIIEGDKRGKIKGVNKWEHALRKGQYEDALDLVLDPHYSFPRQDAMTLLTALRHRSALRTALSGRDEVSLQPILRFLVKSISDPRFVKLTTDVAMVLLDIYGAQMGQSPEVDALVRQLHNVVRANWETAQQAWSTIGMMDLLMVEP